MSSQFLLHIDLGKLMARKFLLNRSGDRALSFRGKKLAQAGEQGTQGEAKDRWHTISLYHTESDRYIAYIEYHATWEGEEEWFSAYVANSGEELVAFLQEHDPLSCVFGYPDTAQFKSRNEQMHRVLQTRYDNAMAEVLIAARKKLGDIGGAFVEEV
ncbi:MAG: hypothetical protein AB8G99_00735 [Planctomycetaceae bacterium]